MKLSNLISKFHQTFARVFLAFNLFDSLFPHHAAKLEQNHQVNLKNSEPTQSKRDAAQVQFAGMETGVMESWSIGPNYTWVRPSRVRPWRPIQPKVGSSWRVNYKR